MTKQRILSLALLFIASALYAQLSLVPDQELIKLSGAVTRRTGDDVRGTITAAIASGWHINSAMPFEAKLKGGAASIHATLHYQACNDSVCLPPKNVSADIATNVVAAAAPKA